MKSYRVMMYHLLTDFCCLHYTFVAIFRNDSQRSEAIPLLRETITFSNTLENVSFWCQLHNSYLIWWFKTDNLCSRSSCLCQDRTHCPRRPNIIAHESSSCIFFAWRDKKRQRDVWENGNERKRVCVTMTKNFVSSNHPDRHFVWSVSPQYVQYGQTRRAVMKMVCRLKDIPFISNELKFLCH